jgi:hypothetical protein
MHLSTFSSNQYNKSWKVTWLTLAIICFGFFFSYETFLKNKGFVASIENNKDLWSWYRRNINNDSNALVFLGASRSQLDINIPYAKSTLKNYNITQLSINGHYPMASLQALANDVRFKGTIIVSLTAQALEERYWDMQKQYNSYYDGDSSFYRSLDAYIAAYIKSHFRFLHPLLSLNQLIDFYQKNHQFKDVFYTTANLDQSVSADYTKTNVDRLQKHFFDEKEQQYKNTGQTPPLLWQKNIKLLVEDTQKIKKRGGNVIIIRYPTDKGHWQIDEHYYPRKKYWDLIAQNPNLTAIHFNDITGLNQFNLPDSSHLDQKDTQAFTKILLDYLINKHLLK